MDITASLIEKNSRGIAKAILIVGFIIILELGFILGIMLGAISRF
jgi:hypothetical protein